MPLETQRESIWNLGRLSLLKPVLQACDLQNSQKQRLDCKKNVIFSLCLPAIRMIILPEANGCCQQEVIYLEAQGEKNIMYFKDNIHYNDYSAPKSTQLYQVFSYT